MFFFLPLILLLLITVVLFFCFLFLFQGLENCFIWDDKHGFGFNKDGEVVIVTPNTLPTHSVFNSENFKQMCE